MFDGSPEDRSPVRPGTWQDRRVGRYRILEPLGSGGMATVWKARDELLGHTVAVKILSDHLAASPDSRRRFAHEAHVAATLDHPSITAVYESGEADGATYIAMALVEGETLEERVARSLPPVAAMLHIAIDTASALGYAHARGVIHRDVTSRNVMIAGDGRVLVLDFGLALAEGISRVTSSNVTLGTPAYIAPEVLTGRTADPRSDLYGLGMVLYRGLTGRLAFPCESPEALLFAALNQTPAPPGDFRSGIPSELDRVVLKLLERDPQDRYQNADELLADLRSIEDETTAGAETRAAGRSIAGELVASGRGPLYLAILPFEDGRPGVDPDATAGALRDALGAALSAVGRVHVLSASPADLAESGSDPRALARRIGANLLLGGTLRAEGSRMRVSFWIVDPEGGHKIGGGIVQGSMTDLFGLEDELLDRVGRALGVETAPTAVRRHSKHDPAAGERYLQALRYLRRTDQEASIDGAIAILTRLLSSEGEDAAVHAALTRACLTKFSLTREHVWEARAAEYAARAATLDAGRPEVQLALADLHAVAGRLDDALAEYGRAIELDPRAIEPRLGQARIHQTRQQTAEAEEACRLAISLSPDDPRGYYLLGEIYFNLGQYARAIEPWRRVVQLTPDNARGASNLGSAYFHLDRFDDAVGAYRQSLEIQPNPLAFTNLGTVLFYLERHVEAIEAFEKAVALTPSDPIMWGNLGNACWFIPGRKARAREALDRAIALMRERLSRSPNHAEFWSRLAGWLANLDAREEAAEATQRALSISPGDVHCMVSAGHVYHQIGEREEALHWLREAVTHGYGAEALARSPLLAGLREDPDFRRILGQERADAENAPPGPDTGRKETR